MKTSKKANGGPGLRVSLLKKHVKTNSRVAVQPRIPDLFPATRAFLERLVSNLWDKADHSWNR